MKVTTSRGGVNREHHNSIFQKIIFSLLHFIIVIFCAWLIYLDGITVIGSLFSKQWVIIDVIRANILFSCIVLYWLRHNITLFYLLKRKIEWSEVFGLLIFFAVFEIGLQLLGSGVFREKPIEISWLDIFSFSLLLFGSYLNSFSEMQRKWWKKKPTSIGHCYTEGLFSYSVHINYFGDILLFSGWSLLTHSLIAFIFPLLMTLMFVFIHIPGLDSYLSQRYGSEFNDYSAKTKKLVPFVY